MPTAERTFPRHPGPPCIARPTHRDQRRNRVAAARSLRFNHPISRRAAPASMLKSFADFDYAGFWEPLRGAADSYVGPPPTPEVVAAVELALGNRLPAAYIEFMQYQNGGHPRRTNHRTRQRTSWAADHFAVSCTPSARNQVTLEGDGASNLFFTYGVTRSRSGQIDLRVLIQQDS